MNFADRHLAAVLLEQLGTEDTPKSTQRMVIDSQSRDAAKRLSSRRPNLNFDECYRARLNLQAVNEETVGFT